MTIEQAAQELVDSLAKNGAHISVGAGDVALYCYCESEEDKQKCPQKYDKYSVFPKIVGKGWKRGTYEAKKP